MFSLPIMEPSLGFTDVQNITIPKTSFVNDFGSLRAIKAVLVWKERFNTASVLAFSVLFSCFLTTTLGLEYGSESLRYYISYI